MLDLLEFVLIVLVQTLTAVVVVGLIVLIIGLATQAL